MLQNGNECAQKKRVGGEESGAWGWGKSRMEKKEER